MRAVVSSSVASHSLNAFNLVARKADRISVADIAEIVSRPSMPARLLQTIDDPNYDRGRVLFRRQSGNARLTLFHGGHTMFPEAALAWLEQQRKGQPAVWDIPPARVLDISKPALCAGH